MMGRGKAAASLSRITASFLRARFDEASIIITAIAVSSLTLTSCSPTRTIVVPSQVREVSSHDSLAATVYSRVNNRYIRDSIYIRERSDTIYVNRWHTEWRDSIVLTHDTIRITHTDTIPVVHVQEVIREVPSPIPRFYRFSVWFSILTILALILYIIIRLRI